MKLTINAELEALIRQLDFKTKKELLEKVQTLNWEEDDEFNVTKERWINKISITAEDKLLNTKKSVLDESNTTEEKIEEFISNLQAEIAKFNDASVYVNFLDVMTKFDDYSLDNQISIFKHMPTATSLATSFMWNELNRKVKPSEKGIPVVVPFIEVKEEIKKVGYTIEHIFDISQTEEN